MHRRRARVVGVVVQGDLLVDRVQTERMDVDPDHPGHVALEAGKGGGGRLERVDGGIGVGEGEEDGGGEGREAAGGTDDAGTEDVVDVENLMRDVLLQVDSESLSQVLLLVRVLEEYLSFL